MITQITAVPNLYIGTDIYKQNWTVQYSTDFFANKSLNMHSDLD